MTRLLYILPGLVPPTSEPARDKFHYLSEICEGEVLLPVWWHATSQVSSHLKPNFPVYRVGQFSYHMFLALRFPSVFGKIATFFWYLTRGLQLHHKSKIDVIVAYGTNTPAVAGMILKWLTGAKFVVEIPGVPEDAFRYDAPNPGNRAKVKHFFADQLLNVVGNAADCFKLLYPMQLQNYPALQKKNAAIFHDFVPVRCMQVSGEEEKFILSVGHPWYTKGVDILINAFKSIRNQYPDFKLKFMGHYPDRCILDELAADCTQIEFLAPRANELAMKVISACTIYVLASRTEGMGRVLLEAMAASRPIIASNVGGVPHYISDNENGLLFSSENVEELAAKLALLLNDGGLQSRLGRRGHDRVFFEYDEVAYVREFKKMLQSILIESPRNGSVHENKEEVEPSRL